MKIRLTGTPEQVATGAAMVRRTFDVRAESSDYRNRPPSSLVRRYFTVEPRRRETAPSPTTTSGA